MSTGHRFLSAVALVASVALLLNSAPANANASEHPAVAGLLENVDSEEILETIRDLQAFGNRAFYLNNSSEVADYILTKFQSFGIDVEFQDFMAGIHPSKNIVATQSGGLDGSRQFLIGGHYDSENSMASTLEAAYSLSAPGADDDASGVAAMLEIARVLSQFRLNYTMKYVAFGAEELGYDQSGGLKGSFHFVAQEKARNASYSGTAVLDMIGYQGSEVGHAVAIVQNPLDPIAREMDSAIAEHSINLTLDSVVNGSIAFSDHYPFWISGYPSALITEAAPWTQLPYEFNPYYHTEDDLVDHLSIGQITEVTKVLLAAMLSLNGFVVEAEPTSILLWVVVAVVCAAAVVVAYLVVRARR